MDILGLQIHIGRKCKYLFIFSECLLLDSFSKSAVFVVVSYLSSVWNTWLQFAMYINVACNYSWDNGNTSIESHEGELNGLLVGGIRDNKGSHKWSRNNRIRRGGEKRSGGARRAEEVETSSQRVMWEQRRLWEVWCKGLDLSNGNRLATQRGQLPLSRSLSAHSPVRMGGNRRCIEM